MNAKVLEKIVVGHEMQDPETACTFKKPVANVKIVSLMPFGAFAEIVDGVDGLIHISQIADHKIAKPDEVLAVGQTVDVKITDIDFDKHRVSFSMKALLEAPAKEEAEEAPVEE